MAHHTCSAGDVVPKVSVWSDLTNERRARVIRLLTELAHTIVTNTLQHSAKETNNADPSQDGQDSPRTP
jgi:hypothetical protein